ncbi:MAG: ribosome maturation factor RimP [Chitinivibrionales bacterium]|nr:ribosome maturation factor RimP [Chitinivibrionales bacterium]
MEHFESLISQKLEAMGYELYELKYIRAGSHSILRVFIDKEQGKQGITIADCEKVSTVLSVLLDVENFSTMPYTLEVSSPGIDRILHTEKDFRRVIGKTVRLRVDESLAIKGNTLSGILASCDNGTLTVQTKEDRIPIPLQNVMSGKVEITF